MPWRRPQHAEPCQGCPSPAPFCRCMGAAVTAGLRVWQADSGRSANWKDNPKVWGFFFIKINGTMYKSTARICYFSRNIFSHEKQKRWEKGISGRTKSFYWTCWYHRKETQALGHECPLWGTRGWKPAQFSHMPPTRARDCCNMMGRGHRILE